MPRLPKVDWARDIVATVDISERSKPVPLPEYTAIRYKWTRKLDVLSCSKFELGLDNTNLSIEIFMEVFLLRLPVLVHELKILKCRLCTVTLTMHLPKKINTTIPLVLILELMRRMFPKLQWILPSVLSQTTLSSGFFIFWTMKTLSVHEFLEI